MKDADWRLVMLECLVEISFELSVGVGNRAAREPNTSELSSREWVARVWIEMRLVIGDREVCVINQRRSRIGYRRMCSA